MRFRLTILLPLLTWVIGVHGQFGEIASIVTSVLGSTGGLGSIASAAGGAAPALAGIGPLYQLAQAALSLTGTGVGIANQASESSWFPLAVEHAVKANRDFQERLGPGSTGNKLTSGTFGSSGIKSSSLGTEYGKNFGTDSDGGGDDYDYGTATTKVNVKPSGGGSGGGSGTPSPSLERELAELESTGPGTDEFGRPAEKAAPIVTVQLPKPSVKKTDVKDYEELLGKMYQGHVDFEEDANAEEELEVAKMVPALHALVNALKGSNLTKEEIQEFIGQLEGNEKKGEPRENPNQTPVPTLIESNGEERPELVPPPERKMGRNVEQLRRILAGENGTLPKVLDLPLVVSHHHVHLREGITPTTPEAATPTTTISTSKQTPTPTPTTIHPDPRVYPRRIISSGSSSSTNQHFSTIPPRAVPPRPVANGVPQQQHGVVGAKQIHQAPTTAPQGPRIPHPPATPYRQGQVPPPPPQQGKVPPPQPQQIPQQQYYRRQADVEYENYQRQYWDYLNRYYPQYAATRTPNPPYFAAATAQRPYPLVHPYGQGALITNQQPYHVQG